MEWPVPRRGGSSPTAARWRPTARSGTSSNQGAVRAKAGPTGNADVAVSSLHVKAGANVADRQATRADLHRTARIMTNVEQGTAVEGNLLHLAILERQLAVRGEGNG